MSLVGKDDLDELIFKKIAVAIVCLSKETAVEKAEEGMDDYRSP